MTDHDPWAWAREGDDLGPRPSTLPEQDWDWAHEQSAAPALAVDPADVLAVLVVHQAEEWLERSLAAIATLDPRPGHIVAVETGSTDESAEILGSALEKGILDEVIEAGQQPGFGAAVNHALCAQEQERPWLWLLHDDLEPRPDALRGLLLRAGQDDRPHLLFPKLLQPRRRNYPPQLAEVGSSLTPGGSRYLGLAPGEIDQRQTDSAPVLGGSTAGMLTTLELWRELGGLDPDLPLFRDGQDFGWRANAAGHRVVTAPDAALHHRQEGRFGGRNSALVGEAATTDRLLGVRMLAAHATAPGRELARQRTRALWRGMGYMLGKAPSEARAEWAAARRMGSQRAAINRMRERALGPSTLTEGLLPTSGQLWSARLERLHDAAGESWRERRELDPDTSLDDLIGDDFAGGRGHRRVLTPGRAVLLLLLVVTLVGARHLFGRGQLSSTALTPSPHGLSAAWHSWLHPVAGEAGLNAGWLGLMALGSTVTGGQPEVFVRLLVLGAPLLGSLLAHRVARRLMGDTWLAAVLAACWGAVALLSGTTGRGSVSGALATILLPLVASAALTWFREDQERGLAERLRSPASLALLLGLLAQASPAFAGLGLVLALTHLLGRRRPELAQLVALLGPVLTLLPWLPRLVQHPGRLLTGTDPTAAALTPPPPAWQVLLGRGESAGLPPITLSIAATACLVALVAVALASAGASLRLSTLVGLTSGAAVSIAVAAWLTRVLVTVDGRPVRPNTENWLLLAAGLALLLCAFALRASSKEAHREGMRHLRSGHLLALLAGVALVLLASTLAVLGAERAPLKVRPDPLPEFVATVQDSSRATRTLLLQANTDGSHHWTLTSTMRPSWGSGETYPVLANPEQSDQVAALAAQVAAGAPSDDLATRLARLGIAHVVMRGGSESALAGVSNSPGLTTSPVEDDTVVWTVQGLTSRLALLQDQGLTSLPAAKVDQQGTLRIAEDWDDRWVVTVGGHRVPASADPSGFGITAPTQGHTGDVRWHVATPWGLLAGQLGVVLLLLLLAAPTVRRQGARPPARSLDAGRTR